MKTGIWLILRLEERHPWDKNNTDKVKHKQEYEKIFQTA